MIVKNEERVLKRCLDSIHDLVDEIIIIDTGSSDATKGIASEYTDKIYDFEWIDDFSAARNFSFSKCSMDYIYVADADEYLDKENRLQFRLLKENIYPEIEIVQMMYETLSHDTVLNINREYRPKLFKRLREFTWINPIHETVRLAPLVFDSDIVVTHAPESNHAKRDFTIFEKTINETGGLSEALSLMYAKELYRNGDLSDFNNAAGYFESVYEYISNNMECMTPDINSNSTLIGNDELVCAAIILAKWKRLNSQNDFSEFVAAQISVNCNISELHYEYGEHLASTHDYEGACISFKNAVQAASFLDIHTSGDDALKKLIECCKKAIDLYDSHDSSNSSNRLTIDDLYSLKKDASDLLNNWKMPEEDIT